MVSVHGLTRMFNGFVAYCAPYESLDFHQSNGQMRYENC